MEKYLIHLIINKELYLNDEITKETYERVNNIIMERINGLYKGKRAD